MFNRSAFNRSAFNQPAVIFVYGQITIPGVGEITVSGSVEAYPALTMDGAGEIQFDAIRELHFSATLEAVGELNADAIRERISALVLDAFGSMTVAANRFHVDYIEFTGNFNPGDRIVIDSKKLKMTLNNANALHLMQGDFFDLNLGSNELVYTDPETARSILIRFTHRDKFV